ncbi:MAG: glycosyltransferase family 2 protein [Candidatus Daviesbacteria bacterium]|nr:glycosyltransferase family 2 protein [Candidatus Daviesbacteria bacterium]
MNKVYTNKLKKTIWAHTLVRNEENFIWFAINSVIDYVDKILIYDLGSTDQTVEIIRTIKSPKIVLKELPINKDMIELGQRRQQMLDESKGDWIILLDGDEIWPDESIKKLISTIEQNPNKDCIIVPTLMLLGDIFHYQEAAAGEYQIAGRRGHFNVRAINAKIPGLHIETSKNNQGLFREGYFDKEGKLIYERGEEELIFLDAPYLHASHLKRSSKDGEILERGMRLFKYELGVPFPKDFKFPSIFFKKYPSIVENPLKKISLKYQISALIQTPLKKIKRRLKR